VSQLFLPRAAAEAWLQGVPPGADPLLPSQTLAGCAVGLRKSTIHAHLMLGF